jgi:hypothetical protein
MIVPCLRTLAVAVALLLVEAGVSFLPVSAQPAQSAITLFSLGPAAVSGTDWTFSDDVAIGAGAFESVTVTNYGYCFVGPNDPRAGTAHAGGAYWFGELQAQAPQSGGYIFTGGLSGGHGSQASGRVTVTTNGDPSAPLTHVDVSLSGDDLTYLSGESLNICLLASD